MANSLLNLQFDQAVIDQDPVTGPQVLMDVA
jgi:hypothetical protein